MSQSRADLGSLGDTSVGADLKGDCVSPRIVRYSMFSKMFMYKNVMDWYVSGEVLERTEGIVELS